MRVATSCSPPPLVGLARDWRKATSALHKEVQPWSSCISAVISILQQTPQIFSEPPLNPKTLSELHVGKLAVFAPALVQACAASACLHVGQGRAGRRPGFYLLLDTGFPGV